MGERGNNKEEVTEKEVKELDSSDDADDPDFSEAVALSMVGEGDLLKPKPTMHLQSIPIISMAN